VIQNDFTRRTNYWSLASLIFGTLGLLFALTAPIPFVLVISVFNWPLGVAALLTGWKGGQLAKIVGDPRGASRARWGMRLGCLGWTVQFITSIVKVLLFTGLLVSFISPIVAGLRNGQPTPTQTPTATPAAAARLYISTGASRADDTCPDISFAWQPSHYVHLLPFD
jgi:hypothetical protein